MLSNHTQDQIRSILNATTSGDQPQIPGLTCKFIHGDGTVLFEHASGVRGIGTGQALTADTIFYMASFTKLVTGTACMQLVEQGRIRLDSPEDVARWAPELVDVQVLTRLQDGSLELQPKERLITLRMLLNHTAGFGYAFEEEKYSEWARPVGLDDFSGLPNDVLLRPLINQPGTKFQYGTSVDWVGVIVERLTGCSLEDHFQQAIFNPIGIKSFTFFPGEDAVARLAFMHQRGPGDILKLRDHVYRYPLVTRMSKEHRYCMAGAGLFGQPTELCKLLVVLLNGGACPKSGVRLLQAKTVDEMFTDQIPNLPRDCNEYTPSARPDLANATPLVPGPEGATEGWGLTFSLSHMESATGRAAGTASWEGLPNLFWFADRTNKVGGVIATQILPYGDLNVLKVFEEAEGIVYKELQSTAYRSTVNRDR